MKPLLFIGCLVGFSGCNFNMTYTNRMEDKREAEKVIHSFFDKVKSGKFDEAVEMFSDRAISEDGKDKMRNVLKGARHKLGDFREFPY